jgi:hypothetical protein
MVDLWRVRHRWEIAVEKVEAERVTDKMVFLTRTRVAKSSEGVRYFESFEEARKFGLERSMQKLKKAERDLSSAKSFLKYVEEITEDTVPVSTSTY